MQWKSKNSVNYRKIALVFFLFILSLAASAQGEANIWYFGNHAGYTFNTKPPTFLTDGAQEHLEGMASICDPQGNLLFYTTGVEVWDRLHKRMPNGTGLLGHWSSTQSAVIVPKPGNPDVFYIFTTDAGPYWDDNVEGLRYTTVNLCENNGYGDVVSATKNRLLLKPSPEKISAVYHRNGSDIWVITHALDSDEFYVYLVTQDGVNETPVKTKIGLYYSNGHPGNVLGHTKFSPDGKKVAMVSYIDASIQVFDFNNETGQLSNPVVMYRSYPYGIEFSPDATKLYVSHYDNKQLTQFDLNAGSAVQIASSGVLIASLNEEYINALQLAPDGKIYDSSLGVINKPNEKGSLCEYEHRFIFQAPVFPQRGLCSFVQSYLDPNPYIVYTKSCGNDPFEFHIANESLVESVTWNFGDPSSGINTSSALKPSHTFTATGTYQVSALIKLKSGATIQKNKKVTWFDFIVDLGPDTTICDAPAFLLDATQSEEACYLWHDGSTKPTYNASQTGWHWVDVRVRGCTKRDSVFLEFLKTPIADLGDNRILCEDQFITLDASHPDAGHQWSTGSTDQSISTSQPGIYWVDVFNGSCISRDSIELVFQQKATNRLPRDTVFCEGQALELSLNEPGVTYSWSTGATSFISISQPGMYILQLELNTCKRYDTLYVSKISTFTASRIDSVICEEAAIRLDVTQPFSTYNWSTGDEEPFIDVNSAGQYLVTVSNLCYEKEILFDIKEENCDCDLFVPNVFTPNGDMKNDTFFPVIHQRISSLELGVFNRWGGEIYSADNLNSSWKGEKAETGVYYWVARYRCLHDNQEVFREKKGFVQLLR